MLTSRTFLIGVLAGLGLCYAYHHFGLPGARHGSMSGQAGA
jgi:hypothetical protein